MSPKHSIFKQFRLTSFPVSFIFREILPRQHNLFTSEKEKWIAHLLPITLHFLYTLHRAVPVNVSVPSSLYIFLTFVEVAWYVNIFPTISRTLGHLNLKSPFAKERNVTNLTLYPISTFSQCLLIYSPFPVFCSMQFWLWCNIKKINISLFTFCEEKTKGEGWSYTLIRTLLETSI